MKGLKNKMSIKAFCKRGLAVLLACAMVATGLPAMTTYAEETTNTPAVLEVIPTEGMTVSVSDTDPDNSSSNKDSIFDNDRTTYWTSGKATDTVADGSKWLKVDLGDIYKIGKIEYTPRYHAQSEYWACTGNIKKLVVEVSTDGNVWTTMTPDGGEDLASKIVKTNDTSYFPHAVTFDVVEAQYIRITGLESYHWQAENANKYITVADLAIYQANESATVEPTGITVEPATTQYYQGDTVNNSDVVVTLNYNNDTTEILATDVYTVSADTSATGTKTVTVTYGEFTATYSITVVAGGTASDARSDYSVEKLRYAAGSVRDGDNAEEGALGYAFDGKTNTLWHSNYSQPSSFDDLWVVMAFEEATLVDAIRYLPRNGVNGDIRGYKIYGTTDKLTFDSGNYSEAYGVYNNFNITNSESIAWVELTASEEGVAWGTTGEWRIAKFAPTELTAVKLVPTATVNGNKFAAAYELRVRTATLADIEITELPDRVVYAVGEELDTTGMVVTALYSNSSTKELSANEYTVSELDSATEGTKTITVTYGDCAKTFDVKVVPAGSAEDPSKDVPLDKITATAGSVEVREGNEGPLELAFDGKENTWWHSEWNPNSWYGTEDCSKHLWVDMTFDDPTVVDAVRYLPRNGNGDITGYQIYGKTSADGEWILLTEGNWDRTGKEWKIAEFNAIELTSVRLVATATYGDSGNNKFASAVELRVRTGELPEGTLDGITITPAKTTYNEGEELDFSVTANYSSGTTVDLVGGYTVAGYDANVCGTQTVTVTYLGVTATFDVTVLNVATVNVSCEEGQGTVQASETSAVQGTSVTLTATPADGYRFVQWKTVDEELVSRDAQCEITVGEADEYSYIAEFKANNSNVINVLRGITLTDDILMGNTEHSPDRYVTWLNNNTYNNQYFDLKGAGTEYKGFTIDLGKTYDAIDSIKLFRYADNRVYRGALIQVATQSDFSDAVTVYCADINGNSVQGVKPTESTYPETSAGRTFVLPDGVAARYVRFYGLSNGTASDSDVHMVEFEVYAVTEDKAPLSNLVAEYANLNSADYTTESWSAYEAVLAEANALLAQYVAANEGEVEALCTKLTDAKNALESLVTKGANWINVELDAASIVNGLSIDMTEETYFGAYKVYVSTDKDATWTENADAYTLVCEGTWDADVETKTTAFKSIANVYQVCLVATDKEEVVIAEPTITTVAKVTEYCAGGSLRMDYGTNYDATCLRFVYTFPETMNGLEADTWFWNYGLTKDLANKKVVESGKWGVKDGLINSNIVFTNVDRENYDTTVYTKLTVTYSDGNGNSLTVYDTVVAERSVNDVANAIERAWLNGELDSTKENQYNYALGILGRPVSAQ